MRSLLPFAVSLRSGRVSRALVITGIFFIGIFIIYTTYKSLRTVPLAATWPGRSELQYYEAYRFPDAQIPPKHMLRSPETYKIDSLRLTDKKHADTMITVFSEDYFSQPDTIIDATIYEWNFDSLYVYTPRFSRRYTNTKVRFDNKYVGLYGKMTIYILDAPSDTSSSFSQTDSYVAEVLSRITINKCHIYIAESSKSMYPVFQSYTSANCTAFYVPDYAIFICDSAPDNFLDESGNPRYRYEAPNNLDSGIILELASIVAEKNARNEELKYDSQTIGSLIKYSNNTDYNILRRVYDSVYDFNIRYDHRLCKKAAEDYGVRFAVAHKNLDTAFLFNHLLPGAVDTSDLLGAFTQAYESNKPKSILSRLWDVMGAIGTIASIGGIILLVNLLFKKPIVLLIKFIYRLIAGYSIFNWLGRRQYLKKICGKYSRIDIPFGRRKRSFAMKDIYIPLKGELDNITKTIDVLDAISMNDRIMITGPPGAGKTMLVKRIAFDLVQHKSNSGIYGLIPVIIELHKITEGKLTLKESITEAFAEYGFPGAYHFIKRCLHKGRLMLLLDGFDEVSAQNKKFVVNEITNLLNHCPRCPAIVTCRTQVYHGEFRDITDRHLEIMPFTDKDIQHFVGVWEGELPSDKSVERFIHYLDSYHRIKSLATNPLLLTIITCLYTDTNFDLPNSRSEFYRTSTSWLLEQWHQQINKYRGNDKHIILQHLALYIQDESAKKGEDRRTIERDVAIKVIQAIAQNIGLDHGDASPILEEIVERSNLLIAIDGGLRYQFVHLSLQEYFAACKLQRDVEGLFSRFKENPDSWREVVKLWCGGPHKSSDLIRMVYSIDELTAFECLADATEVDDDLVMEIVENFKEKLWEDDEQGVIVKAFGSVASDRKPRGKKVFEFLADVVRTSPSAKKRARAAFALAATKHMAAVEILAEKYIEHEEVRIALESMGNLAVKELGRAARLGSLMAVESLAMIGTPPTIEALAKLLYSDDDKIAERSAWWLGSLIQQPDIYQQLSYHNLDYSERNFKTLDWIWKPFRKASLISPVNIIGRIAYLIQNTPNERIPDSSPPIDKRIAIPLILGEDLTTFKSELVSSIGKENLDILVFNNARTSLKNMVAGRDLAESQVGLEYDLSSEVIMECSALSVRVKKLLSGFSQEDIGQFFSLLLAGKNIPTRADWEKFPDQLLLYGNSAWAALRELFYKKRKIGQVFGYILILVLFVLLTLSSLTQLFIPGFEFEKNIINIAGWITGFIILLFGWYNFVFSRNGISIKYPRDFMNYGLKGIYYVPSEYVFGSKSLEGNETKRFLCCSPFAIWLLVLICNTGALLWNTIGPAGVFMGFLLCFVVPIFWEMFGLPAVFKEDVKYAMISMPLLGIWYKFIEQDQRIVHLSQMRRS
ncbi:MAG: NACHT domain-containing protein [Candidatus Zixiibacteriota bacterium]